MHEIQPSQIICAFEQILVLKTDLLSTITSSPTTTASPHCDLNLHIWTSTSISYLADQKGKKNTQPNTRLAKSKCFHQYIFIKF